MPVIAAKREVIYPTVCGRAPEKCQMAGSLDVQKEGKALGLCFSGGWDDGDAFFAA